MFCVSQYIRLLLRALLFFTLKAMQKILYYVGEKILYSRYRRRSILGPTRCFSLSDKSIEFHLSILWKLAAFDLGCGLGLGYEWRKPPWICNHWVLSSRPIDAILLTRVRRLVVLLWKCDCSPHPWLPGRAVVPSRIPYPTKSWVKWSNGRLTWYNNITDLGTEVPLLLASNEYQTPYQSVIISFFLISCFFTLDEASA